LLGIEEFKTALRLDKNVPLGHYHLGFAYASLGRNQEAIAEYEKEIARDPENSSVLYQLGHQLLQTSDFSSARKYLKRATEIDAQNADAFYDLGKALMLAGDADSAVAPLERCAELSPSDPSPHYQLARIFEKLGRRDDAQHEWQLFAEIKKAQPQTGGMASSQPR
jgi:superkiller protein 3